jgi:hypothetical protein
MFTTFKRTSFISIIIITMTTNMTCVAYLFAMITLLMIARSVYQNNVVGVCVCVENSFIECNVLIKNIWRSNDEQWQWRLAQNWVNKSTTFLHSQLLYICVCVCVCVYKNISIYLFKVEAKLDERNSEKLCSLLANICLQFSFILIHKVVVDSQ